jgi:hypothetical protein
VNSDEAAELMRSKLHVEWHLQHHDEYPFVTAVIAVTRAERSGPTHPGAQTMTPVEAKQLYLAAQEAQRRVPTLDTSARQLVMLTAQAAGLHGRSTTTPATVRRKALALIHELDAVKQRVHVLIEACLEYETPPQ